MIDFGTCRKCGGKFSPPEIDDDGEMLVLPSVCCRITGDEMLMNSTPPTGCPFELEHKLITQNVPPEFAKHMSGVRRHATKL